MTTPWTSPDPRPVPGRPADATGDGRPLLEGYLAGHRATLLRICAGLTAEQLAARPGPPSTLSLLGLVRHLAKVERVWLRQRVAGQDIPPLHGGPGPHDTDLERADPAHAERDVQALVDEWRLADGAVAALPFDHDIEVHGGPMSLRMVYVHLIGEYARHNGHADLLRQAVDGVTGR